MTDGPKSYQGIMLSSTFTDLVEHRQAAIAAIQHLGFHPNAMEYSGATVGPDVLDKSLQMVADSAAYILIIGHRYGQSPVDPKRNPDGRSITELEFDEAIRRGLPILLFVMSDDHPVTRATGGWEADPATAAKLVAFIARAKLKNPRDPSSTVTRIWEPFNSKDNFAGRIGIAIGKLALELKEAETAATASTNAFAREVLARLDHLTIPERAVRGAIARFIDVRPDAAEDEVVQAVERFETDYRGLQEQVAAIAIVDNRIASLKVEAEQALADGNLDTARRLYGDAATVAREKATEPVRATAQLLEAEARAHLLALDWEAADKAWAIAAIMLTPFDLEAGEEITWDAGEALAEHGERFARGGALCAAIDRWRSLTEAAAGRDDPIRVASLQNNLGTDLVTQGERTSGEAGLALFADAVTAFRAALTVITKTAMPKDWAMAQNNLGVGLKAQGERTSGEAGLALFADAVAAHRAALTVYTEAATPADWAKAQNNLGNALVRQGERAGGDDGLALLADAVIAYRAALAVFTDATMITDWAKVQNNVGIALQEQGVSTGGEPGLALLADSVAAYRAALTVYTETATPALWAMVKENLALAHEWMAAFGDSRRENLDIAEDALCDALRVNTPEHMSYGFETVTRSLIRVRKELAALNG